MDLLKRTGYDSKINEIKGEMPSIIGLATIASLKDVKNKIPNVRNQKKKKKKKTDFDAKIKDIEDKYFHRI